MEATVTYRAFGTQFGDLDLDFGAGTPPEVVTQLLQCCAESTLPEDTLWAWRVGDRIAGLLEIVACEGAEVLPVRLRCPACAQSIDLELALDALLDAHRQGDPDPCVIDLDGRTVAIRSPTGDDQRTWQQHAVTAPEEDMRMALLRTLLVSEAGRDVPIPEAAIDEIDAAMQQHDPLINVRVDTPCPACGAEEAVDVDVQGAVLRSLRQTQLRLVTEVHRLALHYHWTERQIMALPAWRRARYLTLID